MREIKIIVAGGSGVGKTAIMTEILHKLWELGLDTKVDAVEHERTHDAHEKCLAEVLKDCRITVEEHPIYARAYAELIDPQALARPIISTHAISTVVMGTKGIE